MSKAFLADVIQEAIECTGVAAKHAVDEIMRAIMDTLEEEGVFTWPRFGTFRVVKTRARKALNPRTGEVVKVKAGKTVRFKASPVLKSSV